MSQEITVPKFTCIYVPKIRRVYQNYMQQNGSPYGNMRELPVVGHHFRNFDPATKLLSPLTLQPEPDNAHDPLAIKVQYLNVHIAYIARTATHWIHSVKDKLESGELALYSGLYGTTVYLADPA